MIVKIFFVHQHKRILYYENKKKPDNDNLLVGYDNSVGADAGKKCGECQEIQ